MTTTHADIVDTATQAGGFTTLLAAATAAGLVDTLKSAGPFTVFAPTDDAFAKVDKNALTDLLKPENKSKLAAILTLHVLPGKVMSKDIAGKAMKVKSVNGEELSIDATHGVKVNKASVVKADIETSNGVIHVIDAVMMPAA